MDERPDLITTPNGVRLRSHRISTATVRCEADAGYLVEEDPASDPIEVLLDQGVLWVRASSEGTPVAVLVGAFRVLVEQGSAVVDAGFAGEALVIVTDGRVSITDGVGTVQGLNRGQAGMLDADGTVAAVEELDPDELESDPWVQANIALDAVHEAPDAEPVGVDEPPDRVRPDPAAVVERVLRRLRETRADSGVEAKDGDGSLQNEAAPNPDVTPSTHVKVHLDPPYSGGGDPDGPGRNRKVLVLELVLLGLVIVAAVALIFQFNRKNEVETVAPSIGSPLSVVATTAAPVTTRPVPARPASTTPLPSTGSVVPETATAPAETGPTNAGPTTNGPTTATPTTNRPNSAGAGVPTAKLSTCTLRAGKGQLVASGTARGAGAGARTYEVTVSVETGDRTLGSSTVEVPVEADGGVVDFQATIDVVGDASAAQCNVAVAAT